jgi:biotin-dependent carboxylase-like uncharacterized protein
MKGHLRVLRAGRGETIQDGGRRGYMRYGVTSSGPMDWIAHATANRALGNEPGAAAIEISISGIDLMCEAAPLRIAYAGGDFVFTYNGKRRLPNQGIVRLNPGDLVSVEAGSWGAWTYIAVPEGLDVPPVLNSRSTNLVSKFGGLDGRNLAAGDLLRPMAQTSSGTRTGLEALIAAPWITKSTKRIRLILGPQDDFFESSSIDTLFRESYSVSPRFNRVGYYLDGPPLKHSGKGYNIVSDGIALGSIQVPGSGQAIVLLADRQPTGGYPKIATVIRADVGRLAQTRPGEELRFERVDFDQARDALRELDRDFGRIAEYILPSGSTDSEYLLGCNLIDGVVSIDDD